MNYFWPCFTFVFGLGLGLIVVGVIAAITYFGLRGWLESLRGR